MLKYWVKIFLFLSSYIFLFILLAVKNYNNICLVTILIFLILLILLITRLILKKCESITTKVYTIKDYDFESSNNLAYLLTYVIPFMNTSMNSINDLILQLFLFVFIGFLYINMNMFQVNPTLSLFGYKIYKIQTDKNDKFYLLTKEELKNGSKIKVFKNGNLLISKNKK